MMRLAPLLELSFRLIPSALVLPVHSLLRVFPKILRDSNSPHLHHRRRQEAYDFPKIDDDNFVSQEAYFQCPNQKKSVFLSRSACSPSIIQNTRTMKSFSPFFRYSLLQRDNILLAQLHRCTSSTQLMRRAPEFDTYNTIHQKIFYNFHPFAQREVADLQKALSRHRVHKMLPQKTQKADRCMG